MDGYHISLFIHLLALVAAASASSVVHLSEARGRRAASVAEARQWHALTGSTARVFPIAILVLLATGGYMVGDGSAWSWGAGWVDAGLVGIVALFVNGGVIGARSARIGRALAALGVGEAGKARAALHDPVVANLSWINTGLAIGVVFAMAAKPALVGSLSALVVGAAAGLALGLRLERSAARAPATVAAREDLAS
ncbi:MAG TPA: hypothetical protein VFL93_13935 [Longimicrobiaceae bacterium]|jgi:hypothetical protein|nr:hypothetical protein [Longimicrobiaceae bacterium]